MGKFGNFLKKAAGVITSVASSVVKNIPVVGNFAGAALSSISQKLLQSPTPIKESAAQLVAAPTSFSSDLLKATAGKIGTLALNSISPVKESSQALQLGLKPTPSNPIKASSTDLIGATQSNLRSDAKVNGATKSPNDLATGAGAPKKETSTMTIVLLVIGAVLFAILFLPKLIRSRR